MSTIPASELVAIQPSVLAAGGSTLDIIGLILSTSTRVPIGSVQSFPTQEAVADFFGTSSAEAVAATTYFAGFNNSAKLPGSVLFAQYNTAAVSAYMRGGDVSSLTLAQLQAITGTLTITIDGHAFSNATINLAAASSFSNAASLIQTALNAVKPGPATNCVVTYDSVSGAFIVTSGTTGASSTMTVGTGSAAASLKFTTATGAVLSQGAATAAPVSFMDGIVAVTTNWATFMTLFDPDSSGNANKLLFSDWTNDQNNRYAYICWDTDITPTQSVPAASSLGQLVEDAGNSGTCLNWVPDLAAGTELAAFVCGAAASIDFTETNGRISFAFKAQDGITATVTDATVAANLGGDPQGSSRGNNYNFYGAYGAANIDFTWYQRGFVSGAFLWLDSYINQIWLNNSFQTALLRLLQSARSIPYNAAGNSLIEGALGDAIQAGLNFGAFAPGTISAAQIVAVNTAAGAPIAETLQTQGYYLQVLPATSAVRAQRSSPPAKFWYLDRGSVQAITLNSIAVQ